MANVFPDFAVKQAFEEVGIERDDDIVISAIQTDLVSRSMIIVLKGAIVSCVMAKRKYMNQQDIVYALNSCVIPVSKRESSNLGYLLDTRQFGNMCSTHIDFIWSTMARQGVELPEASVKISNENLVHLQQTVEAVIRGFMELFSRRGQVYGYRLFEQCLCEVFGESTASETVYAAVVV